MTSIRDFGRVAQWLEAEAYQHLKRPVRILLKREEFANAWSGALLLYSFITTGLIGEPSPAFVVHHVLAFTCSGLFAVVFLLGKFSDPLPRFVDRDLQRWLAEIGLASRRDRDSVIFGLEVQQAADRDATTVARLLREAFGGRVMGFQERIELCRLAIRRHPGSTLVLYKNGQLAGCVMVMPLSKEAATQFLNGKICEKHLSAEGILTKGQLRRACPYILVSAIYLRKSFRNTEAREALFLTLFSLIASMLLYSNNFVIFCEPVSPNGLRAAKALGLQTHETESASHHRIFTLQYRKDGTLSSSAADTVRDLHRLRLSLRRRKALPSFLR